MTIATGEQALASDFEKIAFPFWGTIAQIPAGFLICDGNNGTPNLLTRFLQGVATAATDPGATGGATSKTTAGHSHGNSTGMTNGGVGPDASLTATDSIADIRPKFYDVAFITIV